MGVQAMASFLLTLTCLLALQVDLNGKALAEHVKTKCKSDVNNCSTCYTALVEAVLSSDRNMYNLQMAFFSPNGGVPVFVTVKYHYQAANDSTDNTLSLTKTYFWSSAIYFFFHPVGIFQFTSLLFSDPSLRTTTLDLYLSEDCYNASQEFQTMLTQRLKLYAMYQKLSANIDDTYAANSYSDNTLKLWYNNHRSTNIIALITQILFPILAMIFVLLFFIYVLELKPYEIGKKLEREMVSEVKHIRANAEARFWIKIVISILFHLLTLVADSSAFAEYRSLPQDIKNYYYSPPKCFWSIPIVMILFDGVSFLLIFTIPPFLAWKARKWYKLTYCLLSVFACVTSHSYHIIFAFINDPYHATSILLLYAIIAFVHVISFQKIYYFLLHLRGNGNNINRGGDEAFQSRCCRICLTCICFVCMFLIMAFSIGLSLALIILLPINNAIDDAPNRLYVIYQASVTFFAAIIAFQVIFRQNNSPFSVILKCKEICADNELHNFDWTKAAEKEKEIYVADKVIKALENLANRAQIPPEAQDPPQAQVSPVTQVAPGGQGLSGKQADHEVLIQATTTPKDYGATGTTTHA